MKAIVTGATGFLGSHLVALLSSQGWHIIALGRNNKRGEQLSSANVVYRHADISNPQQLAAAFESADVVFHCAALSSDWGEYHDFYKINVQGTRQVMHAAINAGIPRIIYVSSTSVYFNYQDRFALRESQNLTDNFANHYAKTKFLGEQVIIQESRSRLDYVIIRPRGIIGAGDNAIMPRLLRIATSGWLPLINNGNAIVDISYVKNVAHALLLAATRYHASGQCFNISNDQPMMLGDLLQQTFSKLGVKVRFLPLPYHLAHLIAYTLETLVKQNPTKPPALTRYSVGLMAKSQTLNIDKAKQILGYQPQYSLQQAINSYLTGSHNV